VTLFVNNQQPSDTERQLEGEKIFSINYLFLNEKNKISDINTLAVILAFSL
jgi:hypothetical protein